MSAESLTFECSLETFKSAIAEFCQAAPTCDIDSLENGLKAANLMYLAMNEKAASDQQIAASYLEYAHRRYVDRVIQLIMPEAA